MAIITAQQIVDRAAKTLYDQTNIQWPPDELLEHLSDAQRAAVLYLPEINPVAAPFVLESGTRQTIPADGHVLIDVVRNIPGRAIFEIDRSVLDHDTPNWHDMPEGALVQVKNFSYDTRDRRGFYVFPSQSSASPATVEIIYSASPPEITSLADVIGVDDVYQPALLSYVLHRAYGKQLPLEMAQMATAASLRYFEQFVLTLTGQKGEQVRFHPRQETDQLAR